MAPDVLNESWRRLQKEHTPWSVHVTREQLQRHLVKHILECREQVLRDKYRPQPLRRFPLLKPNGKHRVLSAMYLRDKLVQRALLSVLVQRAEAVFHDDSYAYRPGRNTMGALEKVRERIRIGQCWLVDADIKDFFDTIPHHQLRKVIKSFLKDDKAFRLVDLWLTQGAHSRSLLQRRRGIAQGAILSPLFCNLYLHQFDRFLADANIPFVRFADDMLLFCTAKKNAYFAMQFAETRLRRLGLVLHPEKTRVVRSGPSVKFLGQSLPCPPSQ
jgi:group II intron reverse transcriptase/maturase